MSNSYTTFSLACNYNTQTCQIISKGLQEKSMAACLALFGGQPADNNMCDDTLADSESVACNYMGNPTCVFIDKPTLQEAQAACRALPGGQPAAGNQCTM